MTVSAAKRDDIASDLFMALAAVNSWTLEKVGRLYPTLRENGLFDVRALSGLGPEQIQERLSAAGYKRVPVLCAMMALRVQHVALALAEVARSFSRTTKRPETRQPLAITSQVKARLSRGRHTRV